MAKTHKCQKSRSEIEDFIMLDDSARGTLCAIHNTIQSSGNFPRSKHKTLHICPIPKTCNNAPPSKIGVRSRKRSRSNSPKRELPKVFRAQSVSEAHNNCSKPHMYCTIERSRTASPQFRTNFVNVEKTISCPDRMCCHGQRHQNRIISRSSIAVDQFAQNLLYTDGVVNELKDEIERVKHQLHHISKQTLSSESTKSKIPCLVKVPSCTQDDNEDTVLGKLKNENKRLKREIESKKRLLDKAKSDVARAKDILADYEKKVHLLHIQAIKSSKAMKLSKEKFCSCLRDKEHAIKALSESIEFLQKTVNDKEQALTVIQKENEALNESVVALKRACEENCEKCSFLNAANQDFVESIELLRNQLENSTIEIDSQRDTIQILEQRIDELNCTCKRVAAKGKKQKEVYESTIKLNQEEGAKLEEQLKEMSEKLRQADEENKALQDKVFEYELFSDKCKLLEEECKIAQQKLQTSETNFQQEKREMEVLVHQLTEAVKENKATLSQMIELNKQQENIIKSQSMALLTKEEQLKLMEKESEEFKARNTSLSEEIDQLKKELSEPCSREPCLCISKQLEDLKNALDEEKHIKLINNKIIEDQSQTILSLQTQVRDKIFELNQAQCDSKLLEKEIDRINEKLMKKHEELDNEIDQKENLVEKLQILECQRNQLSEEINDFEHMLHQYQKHCRTDDEEHRILEQLKRQIEEQKAQWEAQKQSMAKEKNKAVCAARFATRKLLDTVADFQRQVEAQKKVQLLLTRMLHEKDEQLRVVQSKISSINHITRGTLTTSDKSMKELFFSEVAMEPSEAYTEPSHYSSCSSFYKKHPDAIKPAKKTSCIETCALQIMKALGEGGLERVDEAPSRDLN